MAEISTFSFGHFGRHFLSSFGTDVPPPLPPTCTVFNAIVEQKTLIVCLMNATRFGGKILCQSCQSTANHPPVMSAQNQMRQHLSFLKATLLHKWIAIIK
jgi:hypothetical protein